MELYKKTKNEINRYPTWAKTTLILVNLLSLFGFVLQIISVVESERKIAMAMLLLACVLQFASGNMLKPKEKKDDD